MINRNIGQQIHFRIAPKDKPLGQGGNPVDPFTINQLQITSNNEAVFSMANMDADRLGAIGTAISPGTAVVTVRAASTDNIPEESMEVTVVGPAASFNLTADVL